MLIIILYVHAFIIVGMKVIRHAGVDSRMIILDDQARQQMTLHFQLSLQCNVSPITGFIRHTARYLLVCLIVQNNHPTIHNCSCHACISIHL